MPSPSYDVCVIGSANLDLVTTVARHPLPGETLIADSYHEYPGGKGLNQAVAAARSGAAVCFVGAVGRDDAGDRLAAVLADDGIEPIGLARVDDPTGRAIIVVADSGENSIVVVPGANSSVVLDQPLPSCRVVLAQLEVPVATVADAFARAQAAGATTVLNPAPAAQLSDALIASCDVMVPNEHEVELLGGVDRLVAAGCATVIVTRGSEGAEVHDASGSRRVSTHDVRVIDTTGAGDAFCGALASRLAIGDDVDAAVRWAVAAGALATTQAGAVPAQPVAAEIRDLLGYGA